MNRKTLLTAFLLILGAAALLWWGLRAVRPSQPPVSFEAPGAASAQARDCAYTWATEDLPDLTGQVQAAMQEVQKGAEARAEAYGENCTYADGQAVFTAMETDFNVTLEVSDLQDTEEIGSLIRQSMEMLLARFPTSQTPGPQPGQVTFRFTSAGEEKFLTVKVADFQNLPPGLTGGELYKTLFPDTQ